MENLGIAGPHPKWITLLLVGPGQKVTINSKCPTWRSILSVVSQVSVLSPLIFILYVNGLPSIIESRMLLCADEEKLRLEITGDADACALRRDLNILISWSKK